MTVIVARTEKSSLNARLGRNLAGCRKAMSMTQEQLAQRLGVEPETISRFERGSTAPSLATLERLSVLLQVRISDLLDEPPLSPGDTAMLIHTHLMQLTEQDKAFVLELVKKLCNHLNEKSG